jgi:hypothetical protein
VYFVKAIVLYVDPGGCAVKGVILQPLDFRDHDLEFR